MNMASNQIGIDFLYLDLTVCGRCQGAETNLEEAIDDVIGTLTERGYKVALNKVNICSKELAIEHEFISSPTIRINGEDIALEVRESVCEDCGDLCGDTVECRVWIYDGKEYTEPPKQMIVDAILQAVDRYKDPRPQEAKTPYRLPRNLKIFFDGYEMIDEM